MASDQIGLRSNDPTTIINKNKSPKDGLLMFPANLGVHCTLMRFFKYSYGGVRGSEAEGVSDIVLPLPKQIQDSFKINVAGDEIGAVSASAAQLVAAGGDASDLAGDAGQSIAKSAIDILSGGGGMGDVSTDLLAAGLTKTNPNVANVVKSGKGTALNPFATLVFKGVDLKVHSLEWMLSPDSEQESRTLKNIIKKLQSMVLPTVGGIAAQGELSAIERGLLRYPHMVDIYFQGIDSNYYFKFKTSMISQISVDYTPNGIAINKGGRPSAIRLTLTLQEAFIHTADDYETGEVVTDVLGERTVNGEFESSMSDTGNETSFDDGYAIGAIGSRPGISSGDPSGSGIISNNEIISNNGVLYTRADLNAMNISDATIASDPSYTVQDNITTGQGGTPNPTNLSGSTVATSDGRSGTSVPTAVVFSDEIMVNGQPFTRAELHALDVTDEMIASNPTLYDTSSSSLI